MMSQVPTLPALGERCSVLDTVSKRARTPLRSPICVHGQKCLLVDNARDEIASDMCESRVTSKSHGRVCKLIDLVLSSSIEDTVRVVDETDALRTLVSSTRPLYHGAWTKETLVPRHDVQIFREHGKFDDSRCDLRRRR